MKPIFLNCIILLIILFSNSSFAYLSNIETARVKSLSGAGVGSILLNETITLNPASIAFHGKSTLFYQREGLNLKSESDQRNRSFKEGKRELIALTDTSGPVKGGFALEKSNIDRNRRLRFSSSASSHIGKSTSIGALVKYSEDNYAVSHKTYTYFDIGLSHIFNEDLSFGLLVQNATRGARYKPLAIAGIQYKVFANLDLLLDAGATYEDEPHKNTLERTALQLKAFEQLFLRTGRFYDKIDNLSGSSWGFSWVGPRLSIEYAYKEIRSLDNKMSVLFKKEKAIENVLSLVLVF